MTPQEKIDAIEYLCTAALGSRDRDPSEKVLASEVLRIARDMPLHPMIVEPSDLQKVCRTEPFPLPEPENKS